ncbi:protein IWS1 homolog isoform X3 [Clupea harengus]|uniref:Protein IWS1 homolog isoform X3 n=1 Tax=Clupea harengus TaxID=7950 RepID=A0A6P8FZW5_CLUHA|nr:protein IWS1 homolog isoform X3 [Clupea harengus]
MDGEDEFLSGNHSDDGSGTPVQDEHAPHSDADEEMRSEPRHSEDEGSDGEGGAADSRANGGGSGSDHDEGRGEDSDSDKDAPRADSDSEPERPKPADSDDDDEEAASPPKRRGSTSENEEEHKQNASDSENEEQSKPQPAQSDAGSDSESEAPKSKIRIESDEEDVETKADDKKEDGKWKGVMQSDSEDEVEGRAKPEGSDQEQEGQARQVVEDSDDDEDKPVKRKKAILSDSEEDDNEKVAKKTRRVSEGENSDSDVDPDVAEKSHAAKLRELGSDSEDEDKPKEEGEKKDEKALFGSDSESGEDEEEKMIADIFGESGEEDEEEFTGFNQDELEGDKVKPPANQAVAADDSDSDEGVDRGGRDTISDFMSDFDVMLAKKKAQNRKRRRNRDGGTFISDADDVVSAMITKMTEAAEEDRTLNSQKKPALKKLTLLPTVVMHLKKQDLKETFIDSGVMSAIKEWIGPLPDKSLPALKIRQELLKILQELPSVSQETLKHSGIGRAVMFLYKHPKESRFNKNLALKLINEWSRPIFGLSSNYKVMTREEREQRDLDQQVAPRRGRESSGGQTPRRDLDKVLTGEEKALRPGDPGFCARARVPMPSNKDYVVRPKWNVDSDSNRHGSQSYKKGISRLERHKRRIAEERKRRRLQGAVKINVDGNHWPL